MDKREMEKLMDKYKAEMLEFSRRNNVSGYPQVSGEKIDKREQEMHNALEKDETFERDRSDPLSDAAENQEVRAVQAVPAQQESTAQSIAPVVADAVTDGARVLRSLCAGVNDASTPEQRARCGEINEFLAANPDNGTLKVETYASDRAFGVGSARVMVFLELPSGNVAVFDGLTDIDGISDTVSLPAPPREISQSPQSGSNPRLPYSVYSVYVEHPAYVRAVFTNVPVFSGTESVQPVRMLAKAPGLQEPEPIVVDENSVNTLR
ncbi:MAG: hypothetical protein E7516_00510 [Ruminococcaceae bacterium]|nr:hypothetical protein [Oscillospiraceae bacterium]